MVKDFKKNWYHGTNGFGDVCFDTTPDLNLVATENAVNYLYRMAKEVRLVPFTASMKVENFPILESETNYSNLCWPTYKYCIGNENISRFQ